MGAINPWVQPRERSFVSALYLYGLALRILTLSALLIVDMYKIEHLLLGAAIILADMTVFGWQCSQYASIAKRHFLQTGRFFSWFGGYILMFFLGIVSVVQWWNVSQNIDMSPREWVEELIDSGAEPVPKTTAFDRYELHLSGDRKTLTFSGVFDKEGVIATEQVIRENRRLETVVLDSTGGDLFSARDIARAISERGLDTRVDRMCGATCVLPFMAGINRTLGPGAEIGFHRYGLDFLKLSPYVDLEEEMRFDRSFLQSRDIAPSFIDRIFATERAVLWFPSRFELVQAGVLNAQEP